MAISSSPSLGRVYTPPPPFRPTYMDRETILVTYWCSGFVIVMIILRLIRRYMRTQKVYRDDWWMAASMIPLAIRIALAHLVLVWGTNNISLDGFENFRVKWGIEEEIMRRERGSRMVLAARVAYVAFLWSQKFCITEFHKKLNLTIWNSNYGVLLGALRWGLVGTFVAVVVSVYAECHPFVNYWQVVPDPGPLCRQGAAPLLVTAFCNSFTDIIIFIFPLPAILTSHMTIKRKLILLVSLSLPLLPAALGIYRVFFVYKYQFYQAHRSLFASLECLASCTVANAIVLNSFARDKGPKRNRFRGPGGVDTVYSPEQIKARGRAGFEATYALDMQSMRAGLKVWGSDEDLVKGMGVGMNQELRKMSKLYQRSSGMTTVSWASSAEGVPWTAICDDAHLLRDKRVSDSVKEPIIQPPSPAAHIYRFESGRLHPTGSSEGLWKHGSDPERGSDDALTSISGTSSWNAEEQTDVQHSQEGNHEQYSRGPSLSDVGEAAKARCVRLIE